MRHCVFVKGVLAFCFAIGQTYAIDRVLYWISATTGGLSTQFVHTKIMNAVAMKTNRTLAIFPISSPHYRDSVDLCRVFNFPVSISCCNNQTAPPLLDCREHVSVLKSTNDTICFSGQLQHLFHSVSRETIVQSIGLPIDFSFHPSYQNEIVRFQQALGLLNISKNYTAVHWRRNDQIGSRCRGGLDNSVNCGGPVELIRLIRNYTTDETVYVATDEVKHKVLQRLSKAGFKLYGDAKYEKIVVVSHEVDSYVLEASVLLAAPTFLGWGMSGINDLVEYERMRSDKSFCTAMPTIDPSDNETDVNWCSLYFGLHMRSKYAAGNHHSHHKPKNHKDRNEKEVNVVAAGSTRRLNELAFSFIYELIGKTDPI